MRKYAMSYLSCVLNSEKNLFFGMYTMDDMYIYILNILKNWSQIYFSSRTCCKSHDLFRDELNISSWFCSCRQDDKAYLLIDFSDYLKISVYGCFVLDIASFDFFFFAHDTLFIILMQEFIFSYVLGAIFLQLCKMLRLSDHPIVQKLIDPSLFIHRFTER